MKEVTPEQIEAWKKEHKQIFELDVEGRKCWLKKPGRETIRYAMQKGMADPFAQAEVFLEECWLGGDEAIKADDDLFISASWELQNLITLKVASLKKIS